MCRVAEVIVGELLGQQVREECDRGARPKCRFEIQEVQSGSVERP